MAGNEVDHDFHVASMGFIEQLFEIVKRTIV
jgi:hypothetical protein